MNGRDRRDGAGDVDLLHRGHGLRAWKWSALGEFLERLEGPLLMVVLARLLEPSDFGVLAMVTIPISFMRMFSESGLERAVVQSNQDLRVAANTAFWGNLTVACLGCSTLMVIAPQVAAFFSSTGVESALRILALQLPLGALASVQRALLVRHLDFRKLFVVRLLRSGGPAILVVVLALAGFGFWSLIWGSLAGASLNALLLWIASPWRPSLDLRFDVARSMVRFGGWVILEGILGWLLVWGDSVLVGKFLGARELGVYRVAWSVAGAVFGFVFNPITAVLFPLFSRLQGDRQQLWQYFSRVNRAVMGLCLPMGVGLYFVAPLLVRVVFGERWHGLDITLQLVGLTLGLSWTVGVNTELLKGLGRPDAGAWLSLLHVAIYVPVYFVAAPRGLVFLCVVRLLLAVLGIALQILVCSRLFGRPWSYLADQGRPLILPLIVMSGTLAFMESLVSPSSTLVNVLLLLGFVVVGVVVYFGVLRLVDPPLVMQLTRLGPWKVSPGPESPEGVARGILSSG